MLSNAYVVDVTLADGDRGHCFVPVEFGPDGEVETIVLGMNYLTTEPPHGGTVVGIIHSDGEQAVEAWIEEHPTEYVEISAMTGPQHE